MTSKKLYTDHNDNRVTAQVATNGTLYLDIETFEGDSVTVSVPKDKIKKFVKDLTDIATAPEWTRAQFVRVKPKGFPTYTMFRRPDGKWVTDNDYVFDTQSFLDSNSDLIFEVIA